MAKFDMQLPKDVMSDLKKIDANADKMFGDMTRAGAEVVLNNVRSAVPLSQMSSHVKLTKTYKTPTDGGINTKVFFSGYLPFSTPNRTTFSRRGRSGGKVYTTDKGVPVDFLAQVFEYGRSDRPFPKKPFFRKSFKREEIERAMLREQKKASGGILE
jgi:hypothetical protein